MMGKKRKKKKKQNSKRAAIGIKTKSNINPIVNRPQENSEQTKIMHIWESEIQFMAAVANEWDDKEAGGEIYGLLTPSGEAVILFVTPPGPKAIHEIAHFRQDISFLHIVNKFLRDKFGLFFNGTYHGHQYLGLKVPSGGDTNSLSKIAVKNGYKEIYQVILTFNGYSSGIDKQYSFLKNSAHYPYNRKHRKEKSELFKQKKSHNKKIEINAFCHSEVSGWRPEALNIEIIPGLSPLRRNIMLAACSNPQISELSKLYTYPINQIIFNYSKLTTKQGNNDKILPLNVKKSLEALPFIIQKKTLIKFKDNLIIFTIPIPYQKAKVTIAVYNKLPQKVAGIYLINIMDSNSVADYTKQILPSKSNPKLFDIYESVKEIHMNNVKINYKNKRKISSGVYI